FSAGSLVLSSPTALASLMLPSLVSRYMSMFPVAFRTVAAISFPNLREFGQKRASVALVDYCVSTVSCTSISRQLLLRVASLLQLALLTVFPRKNQFAPFFVPRFQPREPC
ncbi:MAG: hypothetical protein EZS28_033262, partial [Streblomastix strix]